MSTQTDPFPQLSTPLLPSGAPKAPALKGSSVSTHTSTPRSYLDTCISNARVLHGEEGGLEQHQAQLFRSHHGCRSGLVTTSPHKRSRTDTCTCRSCDCILDSSQLSTYTSCTVGTLSSSRKTSLPRSRIPRCASVASTFHRTIHCIMCISSHSQWPCERSLRTFLGGTTLARGHWKPDETDESFCICAECLLVDC